VRRDDLTGQ